MGYRSIVFASRSVPEIDTKRNTLYLSPESWLASGFQLLMMKKEDEIE